LLAAGLRPLVEVIEELASREGLAEAERFWIAQFRAFGFRLTNLMSGGEGSAISRSTQHRKNIGAALKGRKFSDDTLQKMRLAARRRSTEHYKKAVAVRQLNGSYKRRVDA
jgi:hypothetical protein